jgi:DNA-binding response OmpR family regulator
MLPAAPEFGGRAGAVLGGKGSAGAGMGEGTRRTVLVVDDEPPIRELLEAVFEAAGYAVFTAQDGLAALAAIERQPPDLVLSDVTMPRLGGVALYRELRARGYLVPVVFSSAAHDSCLPPDVPFVAKPFQLDRLLAVAEGAAERCGEDGANGQPTARS